MSKKTTIKDILKNLEHIFEKNGLLNKDISKKELKAL